MSILDRLEEEAVKAKQTIEGYWLFEVLRDAQTEIKRLGIEVDKSADIIMKFQEQFTEEELIKLREELQNEK